MQEDYRTILKTSLEKSVYYVSSFNTNDKKDSNNYDKEISYGFDSQETFIEVINGLYYDINIRNIFPDKDNIFYSICKEIGDNYYSLLLDKVDTLLIITRKDFVIKLSKSAEKNNQENKNKKIGIIKIDTVLLELSVSVSANITKQKQNINYIKWPIFLLIGSGISYFLFKNLNHEIVNCLKSLKK